MSGNEAGGSERYECPECDTQFEEFEEFAGIPGRCPNCRARLNGRCPAPDQSRLTDGGTKLDGSERECEAFNCANFARVTVRGNHYCRTHAQYIRSLHTGSGRTEDAEVGSR